MNGPGMALPGLTSFLLLGLVAQRRPSQGRARRTIMDMEERMVFLPGTVTRVCSNGVSLNQLLLTLGAADRMVATVPQVRDNPWFVRLAPRTACLPVPFAPKGAVDLDALLDLDPDLVVVWNDDDLAKRLRGHGVAVLVVRFTTPGEFRAAVMVLGTALGGEAPRRALRFCARYDALRSLVAERLAGMPDEERRRVYYSAGGILSTEGAASIVTSWIEEAGGVNVASQAGVHGARLPVTQELLEAWDPEVIFVRDAQDRERILTDPRCAGLDAVRNGRVHAVPRAVVAWSTRNGESLLQPLWAAKVLHPERFEGIALEAMVEDFFREFYGTEIGSDEVAAVLAGK